MFQYLKQVIHVIRHDGLLTAAGKVWRRIAVIGEKSSYEAWNTAYNALSDDDIQAIRHQITSFKTQPLISILMPVYNVEERWLRSRSFLNGEAAKRFRIARSESPNFAWQSTCQQATNQRIPLLLRTIPARAI